MANPDDFLYEYSVVRYVPHVAREEFLNIGLLMMCKRQKWLKGKIELNEDRLKALDPCVDINKLKHWSSIYGRDDIPFKDIPAEEKYRWLSAVKSAVIQTSPSHPGLVIVSEPEMEKGEKIKTLEKEFDRLFKELVTV